MRRAVVHTCLSVAVLLGVFLAPGASAAESLRDLVADLNAKDAKTRSLAYRALIAKRDPAAVVLLRRALPKYADSGQYLGVLVLDRYAAKDARAAWRKLVKSDVPYLRFCAGLWLARRGEDRWLDDTVEALTAPGVAASPRLWMLQRIHVRDPRPVRDGVRALLRPEEDLAVLRRVVTWLHRNQDTGALPQARAILADERVEVRALSVALLYALGDTARAKDLAAVLKAGVPYADLGVVIEILSANRRVADEILDAVTERVEAEPNAWCLLRQIGLLRRFRHPPARPALRRLVDHANQRVARAAFDALVEMSGPVRDDTLKPLLRGDDVERRLWAAEALRKRDDIGGIGAVVYALQSGTVLQRKTAAAMLGSFVLDMSVEPLLDALEDESAEVRKAALGSLGAVLRALFPYRVLRLGGTGYAADGDAETRAAAIQVIRDWWEVNREADW